MLHTNTSRCAGCGIDPARHDGWCRCRSGAHHGLPGTNSRVPQVCKRCGTAPPAIGAACRCPAKLTDHLQTAAAAIALALLLYATGPLAIAINAAQAAGAAIQTTACTQLFISLVPCP